MLPACKNLHFLKSGKIVLYIFATPTIVIGILGQVGSYYIVGS